MKIQKAENCCVGYEIVNSESRLYVGDLKELGDLVKDIESFLEEESQRIMLENFKMEE